MAVPHQKTLIVIPAYEPTEVLLQLVQALRGAAPEFETLVIDDGSSQTHQDVFEVLEKTDGVSIIRHAVNMGKGAALKTAMNYALVRGDVETIVTADADGQHGAADILKVAKLSCDIPDSIVLGVRSFGSEVPLRSRFGNILTRNVLRIFSGLRLSDTQTGLRAISRRAMREFLKVQSNRYEFELECLLLAQQKGIDIREAPIETIYIDGNSSSHFNPVIDSLKIYFVFLRFSLSSLSCAAIDFILFALLYAITANLLVSVVCSRLISATVNFLLARKVVFKSEGVISRQATQYVLLAAGILAVNYLAMRVLSEDLGLNVLLAKVLIETALFFASFAIQNIFIFRRVTSE
jgi:glycosyltransferase involved in cell wall biosynthesis